MIDAICLRAPKNITFRFYIGSAFKYSYFTVGNGTHEIILTQFNTSFLVFTFVGT